MQKNYNTYFSPKVGGILATIGGAALLVSNLEVGGDTLQIILGAVILISGIGMILKAK